MYHDIQKSLHVVMYFDNITALLILTGLEVRLIPCEVLI